MSFGRTVTSLLDGTEQSVYNAAKFIALNIHELNNMVEARTALMQFSEAVLKSAHLPVEVKEFNG